MDALQVYTVCVCACVRVCVSANLCNCPNGSPKTGAACTKNGAVMCDSCDTGFTINKDKTKCEGAYKAYESLALHLRQIVASV